MICRPNSVVTTCSSNSIYPSAINFARLGGFCTPTDPTAKATLIKTDNLQAKWNFLYIYDSIRISLLVALVLGCLWVLLVQCMPRAIASIASVLAILALATLGVLVLLGKLHGTSTVVNLVVGFLFLAMALLFACYMCCYRLRGKLVSIFLDWAARFFKERCIYFFLTFVFILLTAGLIVLCLFQHLAFTSHNAPIHTTGDIYLQLVPNYVFFVLNLIEFIWGLQFLKDACKWSV